VGEHFHFKYDIPYYNIGVITGPCHAEEVALERLSYLTIACGDAEQNKSFSGKLKLKSLMILRTEYSHAIFTLLLRGWLGLGYGDNFQSVLDGNGNR
jgi:glycerol-3-phosphate dehydrogenase (NAD(P)+)